MNNTPLNLYTLIIAILPKDAQGAGDAAAEEAADTLEMNYRIESFYGEIYYLIYAATTHRVPALIDTLLLLLLLSVTP